LGFGGHIGFVPTGTNLCVPQKTSMSPGQYYWGTRSLIPFGIRAACPLITERRPWVMRVSPSFGKHLPWLLFLLTAGLATRVPHALVAGSYDNRVTYFPTIASTRFVECAREMTRGGVSSDAFSFASPLYIPFLAAFYSLSLGNGAVFLVQGATGVFSGFLVYVVAFRAGASRLFACLGALCFYFYAPAAFFELTLLPAGILAFLIGLWALLEQGAGGRWHSLFKGFLVGVIAGLRPPFILIGFVSLFRGVRKGGTVPFLAGLAVPLLFLSFWHSGQGGGFSPFASATGLNLVLGHADGATGYGPPIVEHGLVETPGEDIHQAAARVAAVHGYDDPVAADRFWLKTAVSWMLANPGRELELLLVKLGGAFGHVPFDVYFDLQRDVASDPSLGHLFVPRFLLVAFLALGAGSLLFHRGACRFLLAPVAVSLLSSVVFVHSERFWIPALPAALAVSAAGLTLFLRGFRHRWKTAVSVTILVLLLLPGILRPTPETPLGLYLYNRAVKVFHMGNMPLSLLLFEEAAEVSPRGTHTSVYARIMAVQIARSLSMEDRADAHALILRQETAPR